MGEAFRVTKKISLSCMGRRKVSIKTYFQCPSYRKSCFLCSFQIETTHCVAKSFGSTSLSDVSFNGSRNNQNELLKTTTLLHLAAFKAGTLVHMGHLGAVDRALEIKACVSPKDV